VTRDTAIRPMCAARSASTILAMILPIAAQVVRTLTEQQFRPRERRVRGR